MGSGDWNDGMNLVGEHGKGESVWLAFFLYDVLMQFSEVPAGDARPVLCRTVRAGGGSSTRRYRAERLGRRMVSPRVLRRWLAAWLANNTECQIDSIAQTWAVLSGVGDTERAARAMESVEQRLVRTNEHDLSSSFTRPLTNPI